MVKPVCKLWIHPKVLQMQTQTARSPQPVKVKKQAHRQKSHGVTKLHIAPLTAKFVIFSVFVYCPTEESNLSLTWNPSNLDHSLTIILWQSYNFRYMHVVYLPYAEHLQRENGGQCGNKRTSQAICNYFFPYDQTYKNKFTLLQWWQGMILQHTILSHKQLTKVM